MMLFGVMCAYLTMCFWLTRLSQSLMSKWETFERASKTSEDLHKCLSAYSSSPKKSLCGRYDESEETLAYFSIRTNFIHCSSEDIHHRIPTHLREEVNDSFFFNEYLALALSEMCVEIVEVPVSTWVTLEFFFCVFFSVSTGGKSSLLR